MDNDEYNRAPANVSTVADLLDHKSISWSEYQEHLPYPGYQVSSSCLRYRHAFAFIKILDSLANTSSTGPQLLQPRDV